MKSGLVIGVLLALLGATEAAAAEPCVGAAARDPWRSCTNPDRWLTVAPSPAEAQRVGNLPCASVTQTGLLYQCGFGVPDEAPSAAVALIGDSHASHWRAALDVMAKRKHWRGTSIARTHCSFSRAKKALPAPERARCVEWNRQLPQWFRGHPEVSTVFVSGITGGRGVVTRGHQLTAQAAGYLAAWKALPRTVEQIVVIRDTPKMREGDGTCVARAMEAQQDAGARCAVPRRKALLADPAVTAARRWNSKRVRVVDLTPWMCDASVCFPVVGGVLTFRDKTHLTRAFSESLAPYLERRFERSA